MAAAYRLRGRADEAEGALGGALWDAGCSAVLIEGGDLVAVFDAVTPEVPDGGAWEGVDERDHVAAYFEGLGPVEVGPLVVAPTHREAHLRAGQRALWLDPGMAFGTGHHETTRLALAALGELDLRGARVLDVGAGSGVLAIAADLLGAASAAGVDVDPITVPIARANALLNRSRATFALADFGAAGAPRASVDVLVANLFAELHVRFMSAYAEALSIGGRLLLTGILHGREDAVAAAAPSELRPVGRRRDGEWWLLAFERVEAT